MSEVTERAKALIDGEAETARAKAAVVAELEQSIQDANAALVALGVKKTRKPRQLKAVKPGKKSTVAPNSKSA